MRRITSWVVLTFITLISPVSAQDALQVINASNIRHLQSVLRIDWSEWSPKVERGWFTINADGSLIAVVDRSESVITVDGNTGERLNSYSVTGADGLPATFLDAAFSSDGEYLTSIHVEGGAYHLAYRPIDSQSPIVARVSSADVPLRIWANQHVWLEVIGSNPNSGHYILQTEYPPISGVDEVAEQSESPSGPENDPDAFLRVGRIAPPTAITMTQGLTVKRWNLETGEVTAAAQIDSLIGAGQVSSDGKYLAWIDQGFEAIHLLNFETGEDQVIAQLEGTYIPFLLLTPAADVIIGVNVGLEPDITAWDVVTGDQIELGQYRTCTRQPDMVRLTRDGTALAIGCDTGIDLWRINATSFVLNY